VVEKIFKVLKPSGGGQNFQSVETFRWWDKNNNSIFPVALIKKVIYYYDVRIYRIISVEIFIIIREKKNFDVNLRVVEKIFKVLKPSGGGTKTIIASLLLL